MFRLEETRWEKPGPHAAQVRGLESVDRLSHVPHLKKTSVGCYENSQDYRWKGLAQGMALDGLP